MEDLSGWEKGTLREIGGIYMDLNGLKHCNDRFGHEAGDALIRRTADALNEVFPGEGYRIGGDEFVVLRCPIGQEDFADKVHQLREALVRHASMPPSAHSGSRWSKICPPSSAKPTTGCTGKRNARSALRGLPFRQIVRNLTTYNKQRPPGDLRRALLCS